MNWLLLIVFGVCIAFVLMVFGVLLVVASSKEMPEPPQVQRRVRLAKKGER